MANCIYCGEDAGLFFKWHKSCREKEKIALAQKAEKLKNAEKQILSLYEEAIINNKDYDVLYIKISNLANENDISLNCMRELLIKAWENMVNKAIEEKGVITAKEENNLFNFAFTKFNLTSEELNRNNVFRRGTMAIIIREISEGRIPDRFMVDNLGVNLLSTESLVYAFHTNYYEDKTRTTYEGRTQGFSMRIVNGLWCRVGDYKGHPVQITERVRVDEGNFIITTKHLYFNGKTKSFRVPYSKIVAFYPYSDGIGICQDKANAKLQIFETPETWFVYNAVTLLSKKNLEVSPQATSKSEEKVYTKKVCASKGTETIIISLQCPCCGKNFPYKAELIKAEKLGDGETIQLNTVCPYCSMPLKGMVQKQFYQCSYCDKKFEYAGEMENHKKECTFKSK